ncbi:MAG: hypothetical protein WD673_16010 [Alphaproteobacteria bacterium]
MCASLNVSGSRCVPSPVGNQPLKSIHHTSLAAPHAANGALDGAEGRHGLRSTVNPGAGK